MHQQHETEPLHYLILASWVWAFYVPFISIIWSKKANILDLKLMNKIVIICFRTRALGFFLKKIKGFFLLKQYAIKELIVHVRFRSWICVECMSTLFQINFEINRVLIFDLQYHCPQTGKTTAIRRINEGSKANPRAEQSTEYRQGNQF